MLFFLLIQLPSWILSLFLGNEASTWVFLGLPLCLVSFGFFNRMACRNRAKENLDLHFHTLGLDEQKHFLQYANFYWFPLTCVQLSRFFSGVVFLSLAVIVVEGYRWLSGGPMNIVLLVGAVVLWVVSNSAQVLYNPLIFFHGQVRKDPSLSNKLTQRAAGDLRNSEVVREALAEYPNLVGGNSYWRSVLYAENPVESADG